MNTTENDNIRIQSKDVSVLEKLRALKERRGFTLVELLIVIAIIAIMAAIIIPNVADRAKSVQDSYATVAMSLFYYGQDVLNNAKTMTVGRTGDFGKWQDMYVWTLKKNITADYTDGSNNLKPPPASGDVNYNTFEDYRTLGKLNAMYFSAARDGATLKLTEMSFIFGDANFVTPAPYGFKDTGTGSPPKITEGWVYNADKDAGVLKFPIKFSYASAVTDSKKEQVHTKEILERISNNLNGMFSLLDIDAEGSFILLFDNQMRVLASYHSKHPFFDNGSGYSWTAGVKGADGKLWMSADGTLLGSKVGGKPSNKDVGAVFHNHALGNVIVGVYPRWLGEDGMAFADRSKSPAKGLNIDDGI